jgi:tRNA (guanine37-N1)-methyltransferase
VLNAHILTLFPEIIKSFSAVGLFGKAISNKKVDIATYQIRDFSLPPHYRVDDTPYGGGAGMVMMAEPLFCGIEYIKQLDPNTKVIYTTPKGQIFDQAKASEWSKLSSLTFISGRYEGIDQRVIDNLVDEEVSLGSFILMGGEVAICTMLEAVVRLIDGVIGNPESLVDESLNENIINETDTIYLEAPQYTKPANFRDILVPEVLLSGDHKKIQEWRNQASKKLSINQKKLK